MMGTGTPVIEARNIVNRFGKVTIHDDLNLSLYANEIVGLVGGSGSGKSVLLRTLVGLRKPQGGQVLVQGSDIVQMDGEEKLARQRAWGVLFQNGALFSGLSVVDNVALPLREHTDLSADDIREIAELKLKLVGLKPEDRLKKPSDLSGGMVKRASLARAMSLDPAILFLDEPTAGLDPIAAAAFDELIANLQQTMGLSVMIITHDLDTLTTLCHRVAVLVDKKIVAGTLLEIMASKHPWIHEYFHGPRMRAVTTTKEKVS